MARTALITDAQMRSSLAVIRSLGKRGIDVTAAEETAFATGFFSKYCKNKFVYPSPKKREAAFTDCLIKQLQRKRYDVLIPVADACLSPIVNNESEISKYTKIALPQKAIFNKAYDKGNTIKIARDCNVPCPDTLFIDSVDDIYRVQDRLCYPVVLKPRIGSGRRGVAICNSLDEIVSFYKTHTLYGPFLLQEYIPNGGELGVYLLLNFKSELRALSVQKRLRTYPIAGGPSTFRETIKNEKSEKAIELAQKLLRAMGWFGVAMVEFRIDQRDGGLRLMEVNPRFWGSLQLSILAGVDFPHLLYSLIVNGDVPPSLDYSEGIKCRWILPGEILWFLASNNKSKNFKKLLDFTTPDDVISRSDFGPTIGFFVGTLRYSMNREMWNFILRR